MKPFLLFIIITLINLNLFAEQIADFTYTIPNYEYYQFENGFELITVENHSNPLIATVTVIRTGLRNESPENNGVSHLLEHMTFNGTEKRTQKQLYDELDFHGIYLNAQTSEDYTTFMALNHKDKIENAVAIMSDMLFYSTFPVEKFEKEKDIVTEEIRKDSENPDYQKEQSFRKAFFKNPPYSMPVIGTIETVQNMSRNQVINYYQTYYSPNNMITIVIGDFTKEEMVGLFRKYFGDISSKSIPQKTIQFQGDFPFFYQEEDEKNKILYVKLPAPTFYSEMFIPFKFYYSYTLDDQSGKLIKSLKEYDSLKIKNIQPTYEYHPEFAFLTLKITSDIDVPFEAIKNKVLQELEHTHQWKLEDKELNSIRRAEAISEVLLTEKILYYGFLKSQELAIGGRDAYEKAIPAILQENKTRINKFFSLYPQLWANSERLFQKSDWPKDITLDHFKKSVSTTEKGKSYIYKHIMDNGLTVIHLQNSDNAILAMHLLFKNRSAWEPEDKTGIADFLHHSLFKTSRNYSEANLQEILKNTGTEIKAFDWGFIPYDDYYNVPEYSYIRILSLDQFFDEIIKIVSDNILYPQFDSHFSDVKKEMLNLAQRTQSNANNKAKEEFLKLLFYPNHPLTKPVSGTSSSIENIKLEDLKTFHQNYFTPGNTILSIVSSLDSSTVFSSIKKYFHNWPKSLQNKQIPSIPVHKNIKSDSTEIGSQQSYIYLGYAFEAEQNEELPLLLMNDLLSSQITFSLREEKGWAYRIGSSIKSWQNHQYFYTTMGTGSENIQRAIKGILNEIMKFKFREISERDLIQTKNSVLAALARRRASRESQAYILGLNDFYSYPLSYFFNIYMQIKNVSLDNIYSTKDNYLQTDYYHLFYTIPREESEELEPIRKMPPGMNR